MSDTINWSELIFSDVEELVLLCFYIVADRDEYTQEKDGPAPRFAIPEASDQFIAGSIDSLTEKKLLDLYFETLGREGSVGNKISGKGMDYIGKKLRNPKSLSSRAMKFSEFFTEHEQVPSTSGSAALGGSPIGTVPLGGGSAKERIVVGFRPKTAARDSLKRAHDSIDDVTAVPASDRVVTLDHNSAPYTKATAALDETIKKFREDHRLDNELGREKPALLKTLEAGRDLLNDFQVRIDAAITTIINPLKILVRRYHGELVGAAAATALAIIVKLFGLA